MDTTRRYREVHKEFTDVRGTLKPPKLTEKYTDYKYFRKAGEHDGHRDFRFIRHPAGKKDKYYLLDGNEDRGNSSQNISIYSTTHGESIKKDENGRPYVVIRYDPKRAGARMPIEKKEGKWFLEDNLGFLWAYDTNNKLTDEQQKYLDIWENLRNEILNHGNYHLREGLDDIEDYFDKEETYSYKFIFNDQQDYRR